MYIYVLLQSYYALFSGLFTVNIFCSVQMDTVSKNHGFKWFAVMVFTLSRLKMDGSGETRFAAVRFTVPGQACGLVTARLRFQVKSTGRFRSGLHSTTSFFQNCDISYAFKFRHAFTASYQLFYISTPTVSPAAAFCADCTSWMHCLRISCCAAMTALYF